MYLKVLTVALLGGLGASGGDWSYSNPRSSQDCCALQLDCCNPPSACCFVADCCVQNLPCCPDGPCCSTAGRAQNSGRQPQFTGDCCALNLPCCNPPSDCCFGIKGGGQSDGVACCCK